MAETRTFEQRWETRTEDAPGVPRGMLYTETPEPMGDFGRWLEREGMTGDSDWPFGSLEAALSAYSNDVDGEMLTGRLALWA